MSTEREPDLSRADAERLLGIRVGGPDALSALLASAAAPPTAAQQSTGEGAALAAFRRAHLTPPPHPRRRTVLKTTLAHLIATKFATTAAFAATAATGGLALAAVTGALPAPVQNVAHSAFGAPAADTSTDSAPSSDVPSSDTPSSDTPSSDEPSSDAPSSDVPSSETPSSDEPSSDEPSSDEPSSSDSSSESGPQPSLTGLCKAFQAHSVDNPGKYLDSAAFSVLVTAAGGKDGVASYCVTLVGAPRTHGKPSGALAPSSASESAPSLPGRARTHRAAARHAGPGKRAGVGHGKPGHAGKR